MSTARLENVAIRGVVCAVPGAPLNVRNLGASIDDEEVSKIAKTVGLRALHRVRDGQTAGDLCISAAERLIEILEWPRDSINGILVVTQNPDHFLPATACIAHRQLGLSDQCLAFDVSLGCSGYVYGLWMASQSIASRTCRRFLLLAGDTISRVVSPEDRSVALLFGDAGSATALEFDQSVAPMSFVLATDGSGADNLIIPAGGFRQPATAEARQRLGDAHNNRRSAVDLYMDGLAIFNFSLQRVPALVKDTMAAHGWQSGDVDTFLFHQANAFMLAKVAKKLGLAPERVPMNIEKYGNTSMASIPLLIADVLAARVGSDRPLRTVMAGFGVGYSWAGLATTLANLPTAVVTV